MNIHNILYCCCCSDSFVELDRASREDDIYYCTSCRDYAEKEGVQYPPDTFTKIIDAWNAN